MTFQFQSLLKAGDTLSQICGLGEDIVLAIITGVVEPPYRPVGAIMGGSFEWHPKKCFWRCCQTNEPKHQYLTRETTSTSSTFLLFCNVATNAAIFPGRLMRCDA